MQGERDLLASSDIVESNELGFPIGLFVRHLEKARCCCVHMTRSRRVLIHRRRREALRPAIE